MGRKVQIQASGSWLLRILPNLNSLNRLSDDILTDFVFAHLMIEDILSLRQVSRLYYNLTHQGIIWKRFLQRLGYEAPPLPPSSRYAPEHLKAFEAERLVTRSLTLRQNWNSHIPVANDFQCFRAHRQILSMIALPGGKHLVASASNPERNFYSVVVYVLDHRTKGLVPIAEYPTKRRAFDLRVKYMTIRGVQSIIIAFNRRKVRQGYEMAGIDPSNYNDILKNPNYPIEPPVPLRYTCVCVQIPLDKLDTLASPKYPPGSPEFFAFASSQPAPFNFITSIRSITELGTIDLAQIDGDPHLAVVKKPRSIDFKNLHNGQTTTLTCGKTVPFSQEDHIICSFRILPDQGEVLVVSYIVLTGLVTLPPPGPPGPLGPGPPARDPEAFCTLDMYRIPPPGQSEGSVITTQKYTRLNFRDIENVQISDPCIFPITSSVPRGPPPPLHIFLRRSKGVELYHTVIPSILTSRFPSPLFAYYDLENLQHSPMHTFSTQTADDDQIRLGRAYALPGSHRCLIYTVPLEDRTESPPLLHLYSHITPNQEGDDESPIRTIKRKVDRPRDKAVVRLASPPELRKQNVLAIAWDEGIGRIFFAKPHDTRLYVVDVAKAPREDKTGQRLPLPLDDERMLEL